MVLDRDKVLTIRITEDERKMLQYLADADGVSQSDFVRIFIRREYEARARSHKPGALPPRRVK